MINQEKLTKEDETNLAGWENKGIRYYYYLNRGLDIVNQFRNLFLGIITVYIALHLNDILWGIVMFIVSVPILTIVGYYNTHRVLKKSDWLGTRFSTHYGIRSFDYAAEQVTLLKELLKEIKKKNGN